METKKNKSLSSRVKRRNKVGFKGIGSHNGDGPYPKSYGDYNNPLDNHKYDSTNRTRNAAIATGKKHYHKHVGSKPFSKLMKILHDFCTVHKDIFEIIAERKKVKASA